MSLSPDPNVPWSTVKRDFMLRILNVSWEAGLLSGSFPWEQYELKVFLPRYLFPVRIYSLSLDGDGVITMFPFLALYEPSFVLFDFSYPQKLPSLSHETPFLEILLMPFAAKTLLLSSS